MQSKLERARAVREHLPRAVMEIILVAMCIGLAFTAPNFATVENVMNILHSSALKGLIAFGMTMLIIEGDIDLSVASVVALGGCLVAYLTQSGVPIPIGIFCALVMGLCIGSFTGLLRNKFGVPSFITTLALMTGLRGVALILTKGFTISPFPEWYNFLGGGYILGVPVPVIIFLVVFCLVQFLMNHTAFGRAVYAVGGNAEAARLSGINVARVRTTVLALTSMLAALSGVLLSSRMLSGDPTVAQGWELDVISAVIIGGVSITGGSGKVWGAFIGIIFIGVLVNGMTLLNLSMNGQYIVRGVLVLAAVMLNQIQSNKLAAVRTV